MKKKFTYTLLLVMAALSLAACGGKKTEETTAAAESTVDVSGLSDVDAIVQKSDGTNLTVELNDGTSLTVDLSEAHTNPAWNLMPGDEVDIYYSGEGDLTDGMKVAEVQMVLPYEETSEEFSDNPQVYGEITAVSDDSITVREEEGRNEEDGAQDGTEYTFKRPSYGTVIGDPQVGSYAQVLYLGELNADDAAAYRICTEDMMEDEASDVYEIQGTLAKYEEGILYLQTDEGTEFKFNVGENEELAAKAEENVGKKVKVSYDSIRMRVGNADGITAVA